MRAISFAATAALALTGCIDSGPTRISYVTVENAYRYSEFATAASPGELRIVIVGDPFSVGRERFDEAVIEAMDGHHFGPPVEFTTAAEAHVSPHHTVVMMFDAPISTSEVALCQTSPSAGQPATATTQPAPSPDQPVYVMAAFCQDGQTLTYLGGVMARSGLDDPRFRDFVGQVTMQLFPIRNRDAEHDGNIVFP